MERTGIQIFIVYPLLLCVLCYRVQNFRIEKKKKKKEEMDVRILALFYRVIRYHVNCYHKQCQYVHLNRWKNRNKRQRKWNYENPIMQLFCHTLTRIWSNYYLDFSCGFNVRFSVVSCLCHVFLSFIPNLELKTWSSIHSKRYERYRVMYKYMTLNRC